MRPWNESCPCVQGMLWGSAVLGASVSGSLVSKASVLSAIGAVFRGVHLLREKMPSGLPMHAR